MAITLPKLQPTLLQQLPYEVQEWIRQLQNIVIASGGTVTQVTVTTAAGVSGSVANPTSTPAITITLGAITPTSVAATGALSGTSITVTGVVSAGTKLYPSTPAGAAQTATSMYGGTGAPNNADGGNGDIYFRSDGGALTTIYQRRAGAWVGIV